MARNIGNSRDKLASLKINTNIDLFDSRTPLHSNTSVKKSPQMNNISPKKINYNNQLIQGNIPSSGNGTALNLNTPTMTQANISGKNSLTQEIENKYKLNAAYAGYRSNSKSGSISKASTYNKDSNKLKEVLDLDAKFFHNTPGDTLSPKSTKMSASKGLNSTHNKFAPMSTRNSSGSGGHFINGSHGSFTTSKKDSESHGNENNGPELVNVMSLLGAQNNTPISLKNLNANIPNYDPSKYSVKSMSVIKAYAANTHQGIIR